MSEAVDDFFAPPALALPFDAAAWDSAPLRTERLVLRPLRVEDSADVWEYQRIADVLRFIPWPPRTRDEGYAHTLRRSQSRVLTADGDALMLAVELPGEAAVEGTGDRVIGDVMLRVDSVDAAALELGWVFHPDFQDHGYATEAATAVLRAAFQQVNAHRVLARLDPRNAASAAICRRLGMRHEGRELESFYDKGEWQDGDTYAILRREWAASPAR
ncbi:GNAT family N-acetyltransferase [Rathayibacter sp. YIM 133350]|uniref:GNAT family N-acetyltransferase n=1 Tax=Rathayibacter sp. YIM 133350 TaxID=3131992 RepID=UPI00307EDC27